MGKKKKESKKHKRRKHEPEYFSSDTESEVSSHDGGRRRRKEKKKKLRKPRRRVSSESAESLNAFGEVHNILKTPPKHQKVKRIMYKRKMRNIDPDTFVSLGRFAYDKEKLIQQAFLTLRRGVLEKICPKELEHLSIDELKTKLTVAAKTMSKERLRRYIDDEDLSHSSATSEAETPTDDSESELEIVEADELLEFIAAEKVKAEDAEREMRERLARKVVEKKVVQRQQELEEERKKNLEEGEIGSDENNELPNIPFFPQSAPLPPQLPELFFVPPPPPPPEVAEDFNQATPSPEVEIEKNEPSQVSAVSSAPVASGSQCSIILQYDTASVENTEGTVVVGASVSVKPPAAETSDDVTADAEVEPAPKISKSVEESKVTKSLTLDEEIDYEDDIGEDPDIDLF